MASDSRKKKKERERKKKLHMNKLYKKQKKNEGISDSQQKMGKFLIYLLGAMIVATCGFAFYSMM